MDVSSTFWPETDSGPNFLPRATVPAADDDAGAGPEGAHSAQRGDRRARVRVTGCGSEYPHAIEYPWSLAYPFSRLPLRAGSGKLDTGKVGGRREKG